MLGVPSSLLEWCIGVRRGQRRSSSAAV